VRHHEKNLVRHLVHGWIHETKTRKVHQHVNLRGWKFVTLLGKLERLLLDLAPWRGRHKSYLTELALLDSWRSQWKSMHLKQQKMSLNKWCEQNVDLQFNPKSCNVKIAGFDRSPWMATRMSPLSVGTRRRSHALLMESREWDCCNCTDRNSMSSSSAGMVLNMLRKSKISI
jgi:hypothetical protein